MTGDAVDSVSIVADGALVFGVQLPVQALSRVIAAPWEIEGRHGISFRARVIAAAGPASAKSAAAA